MIVDDAERWAVALEQAQNESREVAEGDDMCTSWSCEMR